MFVVWCMKALRLCERYYLCLRGFERCLHRLGLWKVMCIYLPMVVD